MALPSELFFVDKINQGLLLDERLDSTERKLLLTPVHEVVGQLDPQLAQALQAKAAAALSRAYTSDIAGKSRRKGLIWSDFNGQLYRESKCVISGIVQNWYLGEGRAMERRAFGISSKALVVTGVVAVVVILTLNILRC